MVAATSKASHQDKIGGRLRRLRRYHHNVGFLSPISIETMSLLAKVKPYGITTRDNNCFRLKPSLNVKA